MAISLFDSAFYGELFSDPTVRDLLSDEHRIKCMAAVEAALAKTLGDMDIIPKAAGTEIQQAAENLDIAPQALAKSMAENRIPVTGLVAALRDNVGSEAGHYVHWGATSQDIVDSAQVLILRDCIDVIRRRTRQLIKQLTELMRNHGATVMAARTRGQQAIPISFALKVATWLAPLLRHLERLEQLSPRLLVLQFGGAAGSLAPFGTVGDTVAKILADELSLGAPDLPWHGQRDSIAEFAAWLTLMSGSLGKLGTDLSLMAQNEVAEVSFAGGGRSSTMPQKANPIGPETLVAGAALTRDNLASVMAGLGHEHERGGPQLILEWASLPQMVLITAANLDLAIKTIEGLQINTERMRQNLSSNGGSLAEAAAFALAEHMVMGEARKLVGQAVARQAQEQGRHLLDILADLSDTPVDWTALKEPANYLGAANEFVEAVASRAENLLLE